MPRKPAIAELCKKYRNEDAHSRHVADMALALWDAAHSELGFPEMLRPLCNAAALLHDIGYDRNPDDHQAESARLILRHGAATLTDKQAKIVAGAVLLHKRDFEASCADPLFEDPETAVSAKVIGAILRIADGLDCCHCQNAKIHAVHAAPDRLVCVVSSPGYGGNLTKAAANADLWRRVTGADFTIEEYAMAGGSARFAGILVPSDAMVDVVRKLLLLHYRLFASQREGILEGHSVEPLHEARLAIRRYRAVLKTFSPFVKGRTPRTLDTGLAALCRKLSPFRDEDVWRSFLTMQRQSPAFQKDPSFGRFCASQLQPRDAGGGTLASILSDDAYLTLMREMARFPRTRLAPLMASLPSPLPFAARRLAADYWNIAALPEVTKESSPEKIHALRKRCRAARYRAEFFQPLLGEPAGFFVALFKELSDALGELHDADVAVARLEHDPSKAAQRLVPVLDAVKKRQRAIFRRSFETLFSAVAPEVLQTLWSTGTDAIPILCLARHATAANAERDHPRPLTNKGINEAKILGKALAIMHCRPVVVATSPLVRALFTAELLGNELSFGKKTVETEVLLPGAVPEDTLSVLSKSCTGTTLCVGHLPHLDKLVRFLLLDGIAKKISLAKASVCCIAFPEGKIEKGGGEMVWYFPQKKLQRLIDRFHAGCEK